ncbi:inactive protein RESTRICTED TEV MOVEMENT 1-like [Lycium ferocissimum]|uniref:inactive protein RESTRICTED TEV MOVEMENT 1-like n=1 Tax=Lycium ferocissimum TaxID=112874 RepID=UPI002814CB1D|nr:inactive protein RESTRICTED TEV MOVEMENT 1-like [Lycium ferocissimum]
MDMIKFGPVGGPSKEGSTVWDEKGKGEIAKIFVSTGIGSNFILSLQFLFVENGQFVLPQRHGADYNYDLATTFTTVILDYPLEFLTGIKGTSHSNGLRSIAIVTNKGTHGPYGSERPKRRKKSN